MKEKQSGHYYLHRHGIALCNLGQKKAKTCLWIDQKKKEKYSMFSIFPSSYNQFHIVQLTCVCKCVRV